MENKTYDELDELNQQITSPASPYIFPWINHPIGIARKYIEVSEKLTDESRKKEALGQAARYYLMTESFRNPAKDDHIKNAIELYEQIGDNNGAKKAREILREVYRNKASYYLEHLASEHRHFNWEVDFTNLIDLPQYLTDAGFPELAEKYQRTTDELLRFAKEDLEAIK